MISKPHLVESKGNAKIQCHFNLRILLEPSIEKKKKTKQTHKTEEVHPKFQTRIFIFF